jgi:hypothetical protein
MNLMEVTVSLTVVLGASAAAVAAMSMPSPTGKAQTAGAAATCHTVEDAYAAYSTDHGVPPQRIADIRAYVSGDISGYRLTKDGVAGPGCAVR